MARGGLSPVEEDDEGVLESVLAKASRKIKEFAGQCLCGAAPAPSPLQRQRTLTRQSSALVGARRKEVLRRKAIQIVLHTCGACAGALDSAKRLAASAEEDALGTVQRKRPAAQREQIALFGLDVVNDLLAKKWPHISNWFGEKMKSAVEPILRKHISESIELTCCNLGTAPLRLNDVTSNLYLMQALESETNKENIVLAGDLVYHGDGDLELQLKAGGQQVAKVTLDNLVISGRLVIEFVRLIDVPPWFSGLRVYFPDAPEVSIDVHTEVFMLDQFYNVGALVQSRVVQQVKNVIGNAAVLPNAFTIDFNKGMDPFALKHPQTQGVLRLELCNTLPSGGDGASAASCGGADSLPAASAALASSVHGMDPSGEEAKKAGDRKVRVNDLVEMSEASSATSPSAESKTPRSAWARWFGGGRRAEAPGAAEHSVEISVGNSSRPCTVGEFRDFLLQDLDRQCVKVTIRDAKKAVAHEEEVPVRELLERQRRDIDDIPRPATYRLRPPQELGKELSWLQLRAEWRPCAPCCAESISKALGEQACWALGSSGAANWVLLLDLYHVDGLPKSQDRAQHWVTVSVRRRALPSSAGGTGAGEVLVQQDSLCQEAKTPVQRALDILRVQGDWRAGFPAEAEEALIKHVHPDVWRNTLDVGGFSFDASPAHSSFGLPGFASSGSRAPPGPMDVVWHHPFRLLMDSGDSLLAAIKSLEVVVTIKRPEKGLFRDTQAKRPADRTLAQGSWNLANLLKSDDYCEDVYLHLPAVSGSETSTATVKMRLQVRPLERAPDRREANGTRALVEGFRSRLTVNARAAYDGYKRIRKSVMNSRTVNRLARATSFGAGSNRFESEAGESESSVEGNASNIASPSPWSGRDRSIGEDGDQPATGSFVSNGGDHGGAFFSAAASAGGGRCKDAGAEDEQSPTCEGSLPATGRRFGWLFGDWRRRWRAEPPEADVSSPPDDAPAASIDDAAAEIGGGGDSSGGGGGKRPPSLAAAVAASAAASAPGPRPTAASANAPEAMARSAGGGGGGRGTGAEGSPSGGSFASSSSSWGGQGGGAGSQTSASAASGTARTVGSGGAGPTRPRSCRSPPIGAEAALNRTTYRVAVLSEAVRRDLELAAGSSPETIE